MIILPRGEYLVWALSVPPISEQSNGPLKARIRPLSHNHPEAHRTAKQFLQSTSCEKCKGSGLFYGPLAEGGSMYGLGRVWLINVWRAVPVAGQSVNPRHILFFIFCFPSPIFSVRFDVGTENPTFFPPLIPTQCFGCCPCPTAGTPPTGCAFKELLKVRLHTHQDVQVSNKE